MTTTRLKWFFLLGFLPGGLVACNPLGNAVSSEETERPIVCTLAYRNTPILPLQQSQEVRLSTQNQTQVVRFDDLTWQAHYWPTSSPEGGSLKLSLLQATGEKETDGEGGPQQRELSAHLYQFDSPDVLQIQFVGGHGFTGLHYAYSSRGEGELQYWCSALDASP